MKASEIVKKFICYVLGLFLIAVGVNFTKMSALGISPVSSIPRACEVIFGHFTMGNYVIAIYVVLVLLQLLVLRKEFRPLNLLGVLLAIVFGYMVDLTGIDPKAVGHLLLNFPKPQIYPMKLLYLAAGILIIGVGVFLYLRPKWIPMPAEGLAQAISKKTGKAFGDCKTIVDCSMIFIALVLQLIFLKGIHSFTGDNVIVREGTVIAAVCVGQVVKFLSKIIGQKADSFLNK